MLGPYSVASWRQNALRIERVLDGFVEAKQGVVVVRIDAHRLILEEHRRSVLAPAVVRADPDQLAKGADDRLVLFGILADREAEDEEERPLLERRWQRERPQVEDRQVLQER